MRKFALIAFITLCLFQFPKALAQDSLIFTNNVYNLKSFTLRKTNYEYLSNENGYLLDTYYDTAYLLFTNTSKKGEFELNFYKDLRCVVKKHFPDTLKNIAPIIQFDSFGAIAQLSNWKRYRDLIVSDLSDKVKRGKMKPDEFETFKDFYNKEINVRMVAIEEIVYLYSLVDDTFRTDAEYIRIRQFKSPFTQTPYFIQGNLVVNRLSETGVTWEIEQKHRAGTEEKQHLRLEAQEEMKKRAKPGEPVQEITGVDVNSEYTFYYNNKLRRFMKMNLADVIVINNQSRGNVRTYDLLEIVK